MDDERITLISSMTRNHAFQVSAEQRAVAEAARDAWNREMMEVVKRHPDVMREATEIAQSHGEEVGAVLDVLAKQAVLGPSTEKMEERRCPKCKKLLYEIDAVAFWPGKRLKIVCGRCDEASWEHAGTGYLTTT